MPLYPTSSLSNAKRQCGFFSAARLAGGEVIVQKEFDPFVSVRLTEEIPRFVTEMIWQCFCMKSFINIIGQRRFQSVVRERVGAGKSYDKRGGESTKNSRQAACCSESIIIFQAFDNYRFVVEWWKTLRTKARKKAQLDSFFLCCTYVHHPDPNPILGSTLRSLTLDFRRKRQMVMILQRVLSVQ